MDVNYKTLSWHLKERIKGQGLLKGYRLNWDRFAWTPTADRRKNRSHSIVFVSLFVKAPTPEQRVELMKRMGGFPLLWAEGAGPDYFAEVAIPTEMLIEGLEYLRFVINPVREKASYHILDQRQAAAFTTSGTEAVRRTYEAVDLRQGHEAGVVLGHRSPGQERLASVPYRVDRDRNNDAASDDERRGDGLDPMIEDRCSIRRTPTSPWPSRACGTCGVTSELFLLMDGGTSSRAWAAIGD